MTLRWILGAEFEKSVPILQVLSLMIPVGLAASVFWYQYLILAGEERVLFSVYLMSAVVMLVVMFAFVVRGWNGLGSSSRRGRGCHWWIYVPAPKEILLRLGSYNILIRR